MASVILFDLDDTLFAHRESVNAGILTVMRGLTQPPAAGDEAAEVARWTALEEHHYPRYLSGEIDYLGQRRARARGFLDPLGVTFDSDYEVETWFESYLAQVEAAWDLYPDTISVLDALADRRLGIITNGEHDFQRRKVEVTGIGGRFEHFVSSGELGIVKPDARIFEAACARFGVEPADAVYVGDRLHTDAIGATRAGLRGIWIDRLGATPAELQEAAAYNVPVVTALSQLPPLLA